MKITPIQNIANKISKNERLYDRLNNKILPLGETALAGLTYAYFIQNNKHLEKERKPALHYQNIICTLIGMATANKINNAIQKHQNKIIESLKKNTNIKNSETLINGLKIAMPLVIFTTILRFLLPVVSTPISAKINEIKQRKFNSKNR